VRALHQHEQCGVPVDHLRQNLSLDEVLLKSAVSGLELPLHEPVAKAPHDDDTVIVVQKPSQARLGRQSGLVPVVPMRGSVLLAACEKHVVHREQSYASSKAAEKPSSGRCRRVILVGIAGPSGVGKSTLSHRLAARLKSPVQPLCLDHYFHHKLKHASLGARINYDTPEAIDFVHVRNDLLHVSEVLASTACVPDRLMVGPRQRTNIIGSSFAGKVLGVDPLFIIAEGFLLFCDVQLCRCFDLQLWLEAECDICSRRRRLRGRRKSREGFDKTYQDHIWFHFQLFRQRQLANAQTATFMDGAASIEELLEKASAACLALRTKSRLGRVVTRSQESAQTSETQPISGLGHLFVKQCCPRPSCQGKSKPLPRTHSHARHPFVGQCVHWQRRRGKFMNLSKMKRLQKICARKNRQNN